LLITTSTKHICIRQSFDDLVPLDLEWERLLSSGNGNVPTSRSPGVCFSDSVDPSTTKAMIGLPPGCMRERHLGP
jgi:hypothetical protein